MADRRSTVRINAERLRASLRAGLDGGEEPAAADAAATVDRAMDQAIAGLSGVSDKLKTFDLNVTIGAEVAKEVGGALADLGIGEEMERSNLLTERQAERQTSRRSYPVSRPPSVASPGSKRRMRR